MPVSTTEALAVFVLAILPGLIARGVIAYGEPPLRTRGTLGEIANALALSLVAWVFVYPLDRDLLVRVLDSHKSVEQRVESFVQLTIAVVLIALAVGAAGRIRRYVLRKLAKSAPSGARTKWARVAAAAQESAINQTRPASAWDRLLVQLANDFPDRGFLCVVDTRSGGRRYGLITDSAYLDWQADGRDVLLSLELAPDETGELQSLSGSRGLFVPGDEISTLAAFELSSE
jgi:hypothetical protein